jgi:hypothetical protein
VDIYIDLDADETLAIVKEHIKRHFGDRNWEVEHRAYSGCRATCEWPAPEAVKEPAPGFGPAEVVALQQEGESV